MAKGTRCVSWEKGLGMHDMKSDQIWTMEKRTTYESWEK